MVPRALHVAVGVIFSTDRKILISLRHPDSHQGGLWEFPGGKVEKGETVQQALQRELYEELGVDADIGESIIQVKHDYPDKTVLLDVWSVVNFSGVATGREGQELRWVCVDELQQFQFPVANEPIVKALLSAFN